MNDFQKLICVFDSIGCKYKIITSKEEWQTETQKSSYNGELEWDTVIELDNGIGFYDFTCYHYFLNGKYQGHGCWE